MRPAATEASSRGLERSLDPPLDVAPAASLERGLDDVLERGLECVLDLSLEDFLGHRGKGRWSKRRKGARIWKFPTCHEFEPSCVIPVPPHDE
ncbi:hypothetical protein ACU635_27825 [[Actinomadura] parvosata]|uniref:hypothetical protein n=1 Tax=[Actinomadura] parvosata TaxID=1955412 RepID=UPI00406D3AC8